MPAFIQIGRKCGRKFVSTDGQRRDDVFWRCTELIPKQQLQTQLIMLSSCSLIDFESFNKFPDVMTPLYHWRRNLFNWPGQSRTTFWGGTARNVKSRTTFQGRETINHCVRTMYMLPPIALHFSFTLIKAYICFPTIRSTYFRSSEMKYSVFSERELKFMFAICRRPSVCRLSVTFMRLTQTIEIFGNVSTL